MVLEGVDTMRTIRKIEQSVPNLRPRKKWLHMPEHPWNRNECTIPFQPRLAITAV